MTKKRAVGRPREGDSEKTRRAILGAAEECFAADGFAGTTTRKVARGAAINVATLHYHFGNKEGLYRAVLERAADARLPLADAGRTGGTAAEKVAALVSALYDAGRARPTLARLGLLDLLAGPPAAAEAAEDSRIALVRKTLVPLNGASTRRGLPPSIAARWIVTLIDVALLSAPLAGGRAGDDPSRAAVIAAALRVSGLA